MQTPKRSWHFNTVRLVSGGSVTYEWIWRMVANEDQKRAERSFAVFRECMDDAKANGFGGDIDLEDAYSWSRQASGFVIEERT